MTTAAPTAARPMTAVAARPLPLLPFFVSESFFTGALALAAAVARSLTVPTEIFLVEPLDVAAADAGRIDCVPPRLTLAAAGDGVLREALFFEDEEAPPALFPVRAEAPPAKRASAATTSKAPPPPAEGAAALRGAGAGLALRGAAPFTTAAGFGFGTAGAAAAAAAGAALLVLLGAENASFLEATTRGAAFRGAAGAGGARFGFEGGLAVAAAGAAALAGARAAAAFFLAGAAAAAAAFLAGAVFLLFFA
jgi:hypothetical protein